MAVPGQTLEQFLLTVYLALATSDRTLLRVQEAVSLGDTTFTTADVVAWSVYRRNLRPLMAAQFPGTLPQQPPFPANT